MNRNQSFFSEVIPLQPLRVNNINKKHFLKWLIDPSRVFYCLFLLKQKLALTEQTVPVLLLSANMVFVDSVYFKFPKLEHSQTATNHLYSGPTYRLIFDNKLNTNSETNQGQRKYLEIKVGEGNFFRKYAKKLFFNNRHYTPTVNESDTLLPHVKENNQSELGSL